jgi:hypothetical protein
MPVKLTTTIATISSIYNPINKTLLHEFIQYMKSIGTSENYQNGNLKIMIYLARFLGSDTDFYQVQQRQQILHFLDTRIKDVQSDPDKRWIRTWNDYLQRIKYFFRWLYNQKEAETKGLDALPTSDWTTPVFVQIKEKRTKRISPYLESELWERDDVLCLMRSILHSASDSSKLIWYILYSVSMVLR